MNLVLNHLLQKVVILIFFLQIFFVWAARVQWSKVHRLSPPDTWQTFQFHLDGIRCRCFQEPHGHCIYSIQYISYSFVFTGHAPIVLAGMLWIWVCVHRITCDTVNDFILLVVFQVGVASTGEILPYIAVVPIRNDQKTSTAPPFSFFWSKPSSGTQQTCVGQTMTKLSMWRRSIQSAMKKTNPPSFPCMNM